MGCNAAMMAGFGFIPVMRTQLLFHRHSREGGNPKGASSTPLLNQAPLDSRLRGNDDEGVLRCAHTVGLRGEERNTAAPALF
jgi:hypothetical protein